MKVKTVNQVFKKGSSLQAHRKINKDGSPTIKPSVQGKILKDASSLIKKERDLTKLTLIPTGSSGPSLTLKGNAQSMANLRKMSPLRDRTIFSPGKLSHGSEDGQSVRAFTGIGGKRSSGWNL